MFRAGKLTSSLAGKLHQQQRQLRLKSALTSASSKGAKKPFGSHHQSAKEVRRNYGMAGTEEGSAGFSTMQKLGGAVGVLALGQVLFGETGEFMDLRFDTQKKPVDIVDFYGTESAMEAFSVFPNPTERR